MEQYLIQIFVLLKFSEAPAPFSKSCVRYWPQLCKTRYYFTGDHSNVGAQINVLCARGHTMRDLSTQVLATCQPSRMWYPRPGGFACLPISCGRAPSAIQNSVVTTPQGYVSSKKKLLDVNFNLHCFLMTLSK